MTTLARWMNRSLLSLFMVCLLVWGCGCFSRSYSYTSPRILLKPKPSLAQGEWETDLKGFQSGIFSGSSSTMMEVREGNNSRYLATKPISDFPELREPQPDNSPVSFTLNSDAGVFHFNGIVTGETAQGHYNFSPNEAYATSASKLLNRELTTPDLIELSLLNISLEYIQGVQAAGLTANYDDVLLLKRYAIQSDAIKAYAALGFKAQEIIKLRNHGVSAELAQKFRAFSYGSNVDELVKLRNHGISPEYIQEWRDGGFTLTTDELVRMRNHGVKAEYAAAWKGAGYDFTFEELIKARNFGVPQGFAQAFKEAGYTPSLDEIVRLRQFGVTPEYFTAVKGVRNTYSTEELVRFKQFGVTPEYIKGMNESGSDFNTEQIIRLRNFGVPVEYVMAVNVPGRTPLDAQAIIDLKNRGVSAETARKLRE